MKKKSYLGINSLRNMEDFYTENFFNITEGHKRGLEYTESRSDSKLSFGKKRAIS